MLTFNNSVSFAPGKSTPFLMRNFFEPEDGFVWSTSHWSEIIFAFGNEAPRREKEADLVLDLDVYKAPPDLPVQTVKMYLNGLRIGSFDVARRMTSVVPFDSAILKPTENVLTFDTPDAEAPARFGVADERRLGLQLFSIQIRPAG